MERAIETQRLRLLRLVAGLLVAVGFLSVAAVSRGFSEWVCGYVASVLSRAELAARYLVIAQARVIGSRRGDGVTTALFSEALAQADRPVEGHVSLTDCRARLWALHSVLTNLPRHAQRLLRRIKAQLDGLAASGHRAPHDVESTVAAPCGWRLVSQRIKRPPDKGRVRWSMIALPPVAGREVNVFA